MIAWLDKVLADHAALDMRDPRDREKLAEAIILAAPGRDIAAAITDSAHAVLQQRGVSDGGNGLSREIGNNAAMTVLTTLAGLS